MLVRNGPTRPRHSASGKQETMKIGNELVQEALMSVVSAYWPTSLETLQLGLARKRAGKSWKVWKWPGCNQEFTDIASYRYAQSGCLLMYVNLQGSQILPPLQIWSCTGGLHSQALPHTLLSCSKQCLKDQRSVKRSLDKGCPLHRCLCCHKLKWPTTERVEGDKESSPFGMCLVLKGS